MLTVKKFLPRTLMGRSLLILTLPVLLIQIIATYIFFDRHWSKMTGRLAHAVAGDISVIADQVEVGVSDDDFDRIASYAARGMDMLISFEKDKRIDGSASTPTAVTSYSSVITVALEPALGAKLRRQYVLDVDLEENWVNVAVQLKNGLLHVSVPQRRLFSTSGYIFLLWMIGVSIILLAVAILFMRNQIRPIRRLAVVAERLGRGQDIPSSFKPEGAWEVRQATRAFLDMHERIRRQVQQRTSMLAGVSHDLRTPLTRMKLQIAMMGQTPDTDALKQDVMDMERMIDAYLDFARGAGGEATVRVDLRDMLARVIEALKKQGCSPQLKMEGNLSVSLRPVAFERCLNNVVGNARKYARNMWIEAERLENLICITVDDDGPGISPELYDEVFKPFVRGEPSRNPSTGGVGLGLPIVQDIINSHGGRVWLGKSPQGGLRVNLEIPA